MMAGAEKFVRFCGIEFGKSLLEKEAEYIYQELRDCRKILDAGCGIGAFEQGLTALDVMALYKTLLKQQSLKTSVFLVFSWNL